MATFTAKLKLRSPPPLSTIPLITVPVVPPPDVQGIAVIPQSRWHGAIDLPPPDLLCNLAKALAPKVVLHQPECFSRQPLVQVDGPVQKQVDGSSSSKGGATTNLFRGPQLGRLVATNTILPLLPEHPIVGEVVSQPAGPLISWLCKLKAPNPATNIPLSNPLTSQGLPPLINTCNIGRLDVQAAKKRG